jgi:uncharacterized protein
VQSYDRIPSARLEQTGRLVLLDVVRGVAILGTLATNIWIFTNPQGIIGLLTDPVADPTAGAGAATEWLARALANGKFLGLLTLMFGVGLEIQRRSAIRRGGAWPGWYPWRAVLLLLDGVLHFVLVVEFDILMGYAVTALILAFVIGRPPRVERLWVAVAATVHVLLITAGTLALRATGPVPAGEPATLYTEGSWLEQVQYRIDGVLWVRAEAVFTIPMAMALFLVGAWLYRAGAFGADERARRIRRRLLVVGLGVGLPLDLWLGASGESWLLVQRYVTGPLVSLGYLGLVGLLLDRGRLPAQVVRALSDVGRMALSCYVLQNIVGSVLFYGWGLGLAARLGDTRPWWTLVAWAGISLLVITGARLWLRRFSRGPLELVWAWAYGLPQRRPSPHPVEETRTALPGCRASRGESPADERRPVHQAGPADAVRDQPG